MGTKTITVTNDAYTCIKKLKGVDESFSQLFRRLSTEKVKVKDLLGAVKLNKTDSDAAMKRIRAHRKKMSEDILKRRKHVCP